MRKYSFGIKPVRRRTLSFVWLIPSVSPESSTSDSIFNWPFILLDNKEGINLACLIVFFK